MIRDNKTDRHFLYPVRCILSRTVFWLGLVHRLECHLSEDFYLRFVAKEILDLKNGEDRGKYCTPKARNMHQRVFVHQRVSYVSRRRGSGRKGCGRRPVFHILWFCTFAGVMSKVA